MTCERTDKREKYEDPSSESVSKEGSDSTNSARKMLHDCDTRTGFWKNVTTLVVNYWWSVSIRHSYKDKVSDVRYWRNIYRLPLIKYLATRVKLQQETLLLVKASSYHSYLMILISRWSRSDDNTWFHLTTLLLKRYQYDCMWLEIDIPKYNSKMKWFAMHKRVSCHVFTVGHAS